MTTVIQVQQLGKSYFVQHKATIYPATLRDAVDEFVRGIARTFYRNASDGGQEQEEFWALRDINFEVQQGERVGIIGRNGAGKSTLLKILSMVTEPTTGRVKIRGRLASLLEVGTGFHPELTGRENIFLNGAILGMSRSDIRKRFDEIVDFAEIQRFLDTPVKRYSSGMFVRLAFAVAAHLDPEVLIVDEVLAVGDLQFQRKCLGKMNEAGKAGRTILFVSHNMQAVKQLCTRGIVLQDGRMVYAGPADSAVENYIASFPEAVTTSSLADLLRQVPDDPSFRFTDISITQQGRPVTTVESGKPLELTVEYDIFEKVTGLRVYFDLCDRDSGLLLRSFHDEQFPNAPTVEVGHYRSRAVIPANFLGPVPYLLILRAGIYNVRTCTGDGVRIQLSVENTGIYNRAYLSDTFRGKLSIPMSWTTQKLR